MKVPIYLSAVLLLTVLLATLRGGLFTESDGVRSSSGARRPEIEYRPEALVSLAIPVRGRDPGNIPSASITIIPCNSPRN